MEAPKKRILFRRDEQKQKSSDIKKESPVKKEQADIKDGEALADWIKKADMINRSALCKASKIDRGNLDKYLSKGVIPEQHVPALVLILKNYGYAE